MAKYSIRYRETVLRDDLPRVPVKDMERIFARINTLASNPRPAQSTKLRDREGYRLRQGNYRILYTIEDEILIVEITRIGHRRNVYLQ